MSPETEALLNAYRRQEDAYRRVLELAVEGSRLLRDGRPLAELHRVNLQKKLILQELARADLQKGSEITESRVAPSVGDASAELEGLLMRISSLIERILHQERETDRWIVHGSDDGQWLPMHATAEDLNRWPTGAGRWE